MNTVVKISLFIFAVLGSLCEVAAGKKEKRGLGKFISRFRPRSEDKKLNHEYDPREHLYAQFLNSSFVTAPLPNVTEHAQTQTVRGKGIIDLFKHETTPDSMEKRFMMYLKSLNDNMTAGSGSKSFTRPMRKEITRKFHSARSTPRTVEPKLSVPEEEEVVFSPLLKKNDEGSVPEYGYILNEDLKVTVNKDDMSEYNEKAIPVKIVSLEAETTLVPDDLDQIKMNEVKEEGRNILEEQNEDLTGDIVQGKLTGDYEENSVYKVEEEPIEMMKEEGSELVNEQTWNSAPKLDEKVDHSRFQAREKWRSDDSDDSQTEWFPNEIKYLFPNQL